MKLRYFLLFVMALFAVTASAQNLQEVVYLKNGSIIRGIIIEQIPNESLKIQTADGSVFAYPMDEVEKITKEQPVSASSPTYYSERPTYNRETPLYSRSSLRTGYRGFIDIAYTGGTGDFAEDRIEFSTSHGYQIFPFLFAGLGIGGQYYFDDKIGEIPIFAHLRSEFINNPISPFVDFKIGYTVYNESGFYMSPSVGCRFPFRNHGGVSLSVGYTYQKFDIIWDWKENFGGVTFRVGFDF